MGFEYFWVLGWLTLALWAYLIRCFQMGSTNPSGTTEIPYDVPPNVKDSNNAPRILHQTQSTSTNRDDKTALKTNIICQQADAQQEHSLQLSSKLFPGTGGTLFSTHVFHHLCP